MQTIKSSNLEATTSDPLPEIDAWESSLHVSIKPEITSSFVGEPDTVETKAPEISLLEVIESNYTES